MPSSCSVIGCKSRMNAGPKKQFFRFPLTRPKVLQQWLMVLDRLDWTPKPSSKICSEHFASEDFLFRPNVNVPRLKPEAVPSIFPDPNTSQEEVSNEMKSIKPLLIKDKFTIQNQENLYENSINTKVDKQEEKSSSLIASDVYPKRPKRTSKINVKMKDFILLDDLRKINKPLSLDTSRTKLAEREVSSAQIKLPERLEISNNSKLNERTDVPLKPTSGKEVEVSKVDAAKELLSILEDSDDEPLQNENSQTKNGEITEDEITSSLVVFSDSKSQPVGKVHSRKDTQKTIKKQVLVAKSSDRIFQSGVKITDIASKVKAASFPMRVFSEKLQEYELETAHSISTVTSFNKKNLITIKVSQQAVEAFQISQSEENKILPDLKYKTNYVAEKCSSSNVEFKAVAKSSELMPKSNTSEIKIPMHIRTKRPSTDLAKTYFPIRCGENFFYFSYADLNPVVDLSRHNVLVKEDSLSVPKLNVEISGIVSPNDRAADKTKAQSKKKLKRKNEETNYIEENKKNRNKEQSQDSEITIPVVTEKDIEMTSEISKETHRLDSVSSQENNSISNDQVEFVSENSMDNLQPSDNIVGLENVDIPSPAKKRKKRFKTVAEIVVRTDNAKPGEVPNVSIDKINKIVDFKAAKPPIVKNVRRGKSSHEAANIVDVNDNLNHITLSNDEEPSEEELARLSERITDTVKKMKLLDKVKGNASKLTVLITTLPPVKEKEILIIKKKNLETNIVQSRELQVVISSNKTNESAVHGNIVVTNPLGYTILPAGKNNSSKSSGNDSSTQNSDEGGENGFSPDQEHATIVCFQDKSGSKEVSGKESSLINRESSSFSNDNIEFSNSLNESISVETGEKNSSETIKHDHSYISPNVKYLLANPNVSLNLAEVQSKETALKMKLSENEIIFRNKVGKKLRTLKENLKKKNDTVNKLKDKIKFLERTLKEVKRTKKNPAKLLKKESNALLKNDIFYGVDQLVDTSDFSNTMDYSLNNIELPLGLEENAEETEDDDGERECSSPITYLCEPAIEVPGKERETAN